VVALALEVLDRHPALRLWAAGDEEDRDVGAAPYDGIRATAVTVA
jgi:hypothetical protein